MKNLRRLQVKTQRAADHRTVTDADRRWCAKVGDRLEAFQLDDLIDEGQQILSGGEDPREWRTVRKRPQPLF